MYGILRHILTDQGKSFEYSDISEFCDFYRFCNILTTSYHQQLNDVYETLNQTFQCRLREILHKCKQYSSNLYRNVAVCTYKF